MLRGEAPLEMREKQRNGRVLWAWKQYMIQGDGETEGVYIRMQMEMLR